MKILYDHQIYLIQNFGGISRYFNELMNIANPHIEIERIEPSLFNIIDEPLDSSFLSRAGRFVERKLGVSKPAREAFPVKASVKLESGDFDILHPTYYDPYFLDKTKKPFVLTVHDMIHEVFKEGFSISDPTTHNKVILCKEAKKIIAVSDKTKGDLMSILNIPEDKIVVTHLASDFHLVIPSRPSLPAQLGKYILFVGNRGGYKNFYFMVIALSNLLKNDSELKLLCTGHPFSQDEISFFDNFGIKEQVVNAYLKDDKELAWCYQNAELFIFPSLYEGFGLPILEAFASNCPVVSSNGGSLPEVGGDAALYFDPKSIADIQATVKQVLYSKDIKASLIAKGSHQAKKFSWDRCRMDTLAVYQSM